MHSCIAVMQFFSPHSNHWFFVSKFFLLILGNSSTYGRKLRKIVEISLFISWRCCWIAFPLVWVAIPMFSYSSPAFSPSLRWTSSYDRQHSAFNWRICLTTQPTISTAFSNWKTWICIWPWTLITTPRISWPILSLPTLGKCRRCPKCWHNSYSQPFRHTNLKSQI